MIRFEENEDDIILPRRDTRSYLQIRFRPIGTDCFLVLESPLQRSAYRRGVAV